MKLVQPIKDKAKIREFISCLSDISDRNALLAKIGFNTNLRISDILKLQGKHFYSMAGKEVARKSHIEIREGKTMKNKRIAINKALESAVYPYIDKFEIEPEDYLIINTKSPDRPITRQMAWVVLKYAADECQIENFGPHSMRKSFGYHAYYDSGKDLVLVMQLLNHTNPRTTLTYIGIYQDELDNAYLATNF